MHEPTTDDLDEVLAELVAEITRQAQVIKFLALLLGKTTIQRDKARDLACRLEEMIQDGDGGRISP